MAGKAKEQQLNYKETKKQRPASMEILTPIRFANLHPADEGANQNRLVQSSWFFVSCDFLRLFNRGFYGQTSHLESAVQIVSLGRVTCRRNHP